MTEDQPRGKGNGLWLWYIATCTQPGCHAVHNTYTSHLFPAKVDLINAGWINDDAGKWVCPEHAPAEKESE